MGGYGSGRLAVHQTCEAGIKLDLADPAIRKALHPNVNTGGSWAWSSHGRQIAAISYGWSSTSVQLTLKYTSNGTPVVQTIALMRTTPQFGGERWWFRCPLTGARVRALFLPPGAKLWGGRRAHELAYQSSRESGQERAMLRLLSRHGSWPGDPALRARDPFGFREQRNWERRQEARARRNEVRRIARRQRAGA